MSAGEIVQVAGGLYAASAQGGTALFLLSAPPPIPPPSLQLASVWSDMAAPANPGWFVFLSDPVTQQGAAAAEKALRQVLADLPTTGCAWLSYEPGGAALEVVSMLAALDLQGRGSIVDVDATIPTPPGLLALSFAAGSPVRAWPDAADLQALVIGAPRSSVAAGGVLINLAGDGAGCVAFQALMGQPPGSGAVGLMQISLDPLRPFDPRRSFQVFTGQEYAVVATPDGWRLAALDS